MLCSSSLVRRLLFQGSNVGSNPIQSEKLGKIRMKLERIELSVSAYETDVLPVKL